MANTPERLSDEEPTYHTIASMEALRVGESQIPESHSRKIRIRAVSPTDFVHFWFDPREDAVVGVRPDFGLRGTSDIYAIDQNKQGMDLWLPHRLPAGQETDIGYTAFLARDVPPTPEWQMRVSSLGLDRLAMRLYFQSSAQPEEVYWTEWASVEPGAHIVHEERIQLQEEPVQLESSNPFAVGVAREITNPVAGQVAGYRWDWGYPPGHIRAATLHG